MSTSGSTNYNQTRYDLITDAFNLIGVYGVGRTVSAEDMEIANRFLNKMIKAWSAKGLHLWAKEEGVLYLAPNVSEYILDPTSTSVYFTKKSDEVVTTLSANELTGQTTMSLTSSNGMAISDYIGIVLDTKSIHWTTIASIPDSTSVTINSALPSSASSAALVYTFTTKGEKPLRILSGRLLRGFDSGSTSTQSETLLPSVSYDDYYLMSRLTTSGTVNQFHYNPRLSNGKLLTWPRPDDGSLRIQYTYERALEDFDSTTNNADLPTEWLECITYQLAMRLGPMFGKDERVIQVIGPMATSMLENLMDWDTEVTSITLIPDIYTD